ILFRRSDVVQGHGSVGFAHLRLSIIDLSSDAAQPMTDEKSRFWIIHNGEVFNYIELREELRKKGYVFRSQSDTEVILHAYREWGEACLTRFNGMWAFVIYDLEKNRLFGARDRFGIKPLFFHSNGRHLVFASEIKALLQVPWIPREPFLPAVKDYLFYSRVDTSDTCFFKEIRQLKPGHFFTIDLNKGSELSIQTWWNMRDGLETPPKSEDEAAEGFREHLLNSVKLRLRSDVPVGTCLSGGLDSSAIVALANPFLKEGYQRTFSMVQPGHPFDETPYIDRLIKRYKVQAKKRAINGTDLLLDLQRLIKSHDEPFTSTSMYAQWKVFELAKQNGVTVTLDGQGADESLAGYPYFKMVYWAELLKTVKWGAYLRETRCASSSLLDFGINLASSFSGFMPHRRMIAMARMMDPQYKTFWLNKSYFKDVPLPHGQIEHLFSSSLNQRLYEVFVFDGLPALLRYTDRNSMAHSLESRMPFMDYRLVSFLFSLPPRFKIQNGYSKYIMRRALREDVPDYILQRRDKVPFLTSEAHWFRNEMRALILDVMDSESFRSRPFLLPSKVKMLYNRHLKGEIDASRPIWRILNLELWMREYIDSP
ncbi:MAG: asparagine synthase (glutamine-hydrolyzing), partial [Acidobacteriota bacterium]